MSNILLNVREGMTVLDASGDDIGTVDFVHFSDEDSDRPGSETATPGADAAYTRTSLPEIIADASSAHSVPDELQERLLMQGFVRIDAKGLFAADRYVLPDQILSVSGDEVRLKARWEELIKRV